MNKLNKIRLPLDIMMTILSIILMGGNFLFPAEIVHEIMGVGLFVLWGVHIALNRRWYASLAQASKSITSTNANNRRAYSAIFRGKYNPYRVMQTVINCCILICTIFLMISGIILSNHLFTFFNIQSGLGLARIAHLISSHWYYLFMSLHIGLHVGMITNKMRHPAPSTVILNLLQDLLQMRCRNNFGMTNCTKSFRVLFLSWSALTVFTPSSPGESGNT